MELDLEEGNGWEAPVKAGTNSWGKQGFHRLNITTLLRLNHIHKNSNKSFMSLWLHATSEENLLAHRNLKMKGYCIVIFTRLGYK